MQAQNCCISPVQHCITIYLSLNSAAFLSLHFPSAHSRSEGARATSTMKHCYIDSYKYEDAVFNKNVCVSESERVSEAEESL